MYRFDGDVNYGGHCWTFHWILLQTASRFSFCCLSLTPFHIYFILNKIFGYFFKIYFLIFNILCFSWRVCTLQIFFAVVQFYHIPNILSLTHLIMQINSIFYLHRRSLKRITRKTKKNQFLLSTAVFATSPPSRWFFSSFFFHRKLWRVSYFARQKNNKQLDINWLIWLEFYHYYIYILIFFFCLLFLIIDLLIFGSSHSLIAILFKLPCLLIMLPVCVTFVCVTTLNNVLT
jgi:hypothetical protein